MTLAGTGVERPGVEMREAFCKIVGLIRGLRRVGTPKAIRSLSFVSQPFLIPYVAKAMRSFVILLLSLAMITPVFAAPQELEIPKAPWERIFFWSIDLLSQQARWTPLRQMYIPNGAIEVRLWSGFGLSGLEGLLLRRDGDQWLGLYARDGFEVREVHPETGWNTLWKRVEALGILTLPDSSTLPGEEMVLDGISYVIEINDGKLYRTYHYPNPQFQEWPEAEKIIEIVKTLYGELVKKK